MPTRTEAIFSTLIESTKDFIWSVDLDYRLIAFNGALRENILITLGVELEAGMRFHEMLPPERSALWPPFYRRVLTEGSFRVEYHLILPRILEFTFNPIIVNGKQAGISVFGKDITEQKAAESALREAEKKYRGIFEGALEGMCQVTPEGKFLTANLAMARMLGYSSAAELISLTSDIGRDVWVDPGERSKYLQNLTEQGAAYEFECQFKRKDGTHIWVSLNDRKVCGDDGRVLFLEGFMQEITERKRAEAALRESLESLNESQEIGGLGSYVLDIGTGKWTSSDVMDEIFGIGRDYERTVTGWLALIHPIDRPMMDAYFAEEVLGKGQAFNKEYRTVRQTDQAERWVHGLGKLDFDTLGKPVKMRGVIKDITERKLSDLQLRASEERYRAAFQASFDPVIISQIDGLFIEVNEAFQRTTGFTREEVVGRTIPDLNLWVNPNERIEMVDILRGQGSFRDREYQFRKKNGQLFWGRVTASIIEIGGVPSIFSVVKDTSDARNAAQQIKDLAFYDPLTHLPNRRLLLDRLGQAVPPEVRRARKRAILSIDLDNFKALNDNYGQGIGDLMLQEVARRLTTCVRETDTVARLGSDEYVVILEELNKSQEEAVSQARNVGHKILSAVAEPYILSGLQYHSSASIGIVVFGAYPKDPGSILQQADIAMRQAKADGRNRMHFFTPALQFAVIARASLEEDIRNAIATNQLMLYYQPVVEKEALISVEALIRLNHPKRGILDPVEFISLAEESDLILSLGNWVLDAACTQAAAWIRRKETANIAVAVNISSKQFSQQDFVDQVMAVIDRTGVKPGHIWLEITESMLLGNIDDVVTKMTQLKTAGLRFSLDDFGTGYSSLSYLRRLPLDQLKIDRAFVRDILIDASSGAIAQTIISLGRVMSLSVIAEGVETEEQMHLLAGLGCHSYQGYLFGRPMPVKEFEAWFTKFTGGYSSAPRSN